MVDSSSVLWGQTLLYTVYSLAIMSLMGWFGYRVTKGEESREFKPAVFYSFIALLVAAGVSLHIITHETIPWKPMDLDRANITADREFSINMAKHQFILPAEKMVIKKGEKVKFKVTSEDLTYGFGLFREDNSMVFQMQVIPGHVNDILWVFEKTGVYTIRSTEYSGPRGINMTVRNAVEVIQ